MLRNQSLAFVAGIGSGGEDGSSVILRTFRPLLGDTVRLIVFVGISGEANAIAASFFNAFWTASSSPGATFAMWSIVNIVVESPVLAEMKANATSLSKRYCSIVSKLQ